MSDKTPFLMSKYRPQKKFENGVIFPDVQDTNDDAANTSFSCMRWKTL
jgi:hypothetical protein